MRRVWVYFCAVPLIHVCFCVNIMLLPGKSHGWRSLVGCSPWGREESETTEQLHFHFSLSCFGEGNGNPLQCSCLENPMDGGAWWAAVYGASQSRTRLKRLSSSSSKPSKPSLSSLWTIDDFGVFSSYAPGLKTRLMEIISIFLKTVYKQNVI